MLLDPATSCLNPSAPNFFSEEKIVDVAEVIKWSWPEESEQWLENVGQTHLGLASGKLVLQNMFLLRTMPRPGLWV